MDETLLKELKVKEFHVQPDPVAFDGEPNFICIMLVRNFDAIKQYHIRTANTYFNTAYNAKPKPYLYGPRRTWGYKYYVFHSGNTQCMIVRNKDFIRKRAQYYGKNFTRNKD